MEKKKKIFSLKIKIMVSTLIPMQISMMILLGIIFIFLFSNIDKTTKAEFYSISQKYAYTFENKINDAMHYLSILSTEMENQAREVRNNPSSANREKLQQQVWSTFVSYGLVWGSSVYFEPNQYDNDALNKGSDYGTDLTGRISWYFYYLDDKPVYVKEGYPNEEEFTWPHYTETKKLNKPTFTDPFELEGIEALGTYMVTLAYPIQNDNKEFIGEVTVDIKLEDLYNQIINEEKLYDSESIVISSDSDTLICSQNYGELGKKRNEVGITYPLRKEDKASSAYVDTHKIDERKSLVSVNSLYVSSLDRYFFVAVSAPKIEINAEGTRAAILLVIVSILVVGGIALLLYFLIGKISAPLNEITESANKIAGGDYKTRINGDYKNEFAVVKDSVNTMASSIESYIAASENAQITLDRRLRQQSLMAAMSQSFLSDENIDTLITNALKMIGEFIEVAQILYYKFEKNNNLFICENEYINPDSGNHKSGIGIRQYMPETLITRITNLKGGKEVCLNSSDPELKEALSPYMVNFSNFISVPVFVKGILYGAIDIFRDDDREWGDSDINLATLVSSLLSGVFERYEIETQLITAKELAEQSSNSKSEFLSRMTHEMRTPMNAIIGMTGIAKASNELEKKEYCLDRINNASRHLLGVINDILDMSKIEANKFELSITNFRLEQMIDNILNVINFRVDEKNQALKIFIDPKLPKHILGDEQHLAQVITNLLTNAVKFTPEKGSIELNVILVEERKSSLSIRVEVIDSGIGISKEHQTKLFKSFEQADGSIARKFGGTGLGLAISKRIIELMGGTIWVESEIEKGSKFIFTINAMKAEKKIETEVQHDPKAELITTFEGKTILLAEDVEINREIVVTVLADSKLTIDCAADGQEAIDMFKQNPNKYDLIFMDIQMPEVDGLEATRKIRALKIPKAKNIPIIAMTANVFNEDIEKCLKAGMNEHIGKPIDFDQLFEMLRKYLK